VVNFSKLLSSASRLIFVSFFTLMKGGKAPKNSRGQLTGSDYYGKARRRRKQWVIITGVVLSVSGVEEGRLSETTLVRG
jgi:hypothetical protein